MNERYFSTGAGSIPAPSPPQATVSSRLSSLHDALNPIEGMTKSLEEKLAMVLRPAMPEVANVRAATLTSNVAVIDQLGEVIGRIAAIESSLGSILNRLGLE
jgi:hypothetical protein